MYNNNNISKLLSYTILLCITYFLSVMSTMHYFNRDFDPISRYISEYVWGKYGHFASASFVIYGFAILAIGLLLKRNLSDKLKSRKALSLLSVAGISMVIIGLFNGDMKGTPLTTEGAIHLAAAGVGMPSFIIGSIFISATLRNEEKWRRYATLGLYTGLIALSGLIFLYFGIPADLLNTFHEQIPDTLTIFSDFAGLSERLLLITSAIWMTLIATWHIKNHS